MNRRQAKKVLRARGIDHRLSTLQEAMRASGRVAKRASRTSPRLWCPPRWTAVGYYGRKVGLMFCRQPRIAK